MMTKKTIQISEYQHNPEHSISILPLNILSQSPAQAMSSVSVMAVAPTAIVHSSLVDNTVSQHYGIGEKCMRGIHTSKSTDVRTPYFSSEY
jgi:hypothetical protein